ncbi:hypothetical protein SZ39_3036 [Bacillus mycoides]|nr:hypothetical protein SZ39_3036 [Bacillus mycoides]KZE08260.1 hypothetical protein B4117_0194 [Bacillus mycoides]
MGVVFVLYTIEETHPKIENTSLSSIVISNKKTQGRIP